jgi:hypothetical protein
MKIQIRSERGLLSEKLRQQFERQIYIALRAFSRHLAEVAVTVRDINGPRGGRDKQGQVTVSFRRGVPVVVRATDETHLALAARLAAAARHAVKSRVRRRRTWAIRKLRRQLRKEPNAVWSRRAERAQSQAA